MQFQTPSIFVEFGSGRGQLTYWLTLALAQVNGQDESNDTPRPSSTSTIFKDSKFVLVDRGSQRHKMDNKLKNEESEFISTPRIAEIENIPDFGTVSGQRALN